MLIFTCTLTTQLLNYSGALPCFADQELVKAKKENAYIFEGLREEDLSKEEGEEDPYTAAQLDDGVYDAILASATTEKRRKDGRSFIMNRPPAPAPRPLSAPAKEEVMPYIAQGNLCWHLVSKRFI